MQEWSSSIIASETVVVRFINVYLHVGPKRPDSRSRKWRRQRKDLEDWKGLISADRNDKATLPLTIPRPIRVVCGRAKPQKLPSWNPATAQENRPPPGPIAALGTRAAAVRGRRRPYWLLACNSGGYRCRCGLAWILTF